MRVGSGDMERFDNDKSIHVCRMEESFGVKVDHDLEMFVPDSFEEDEKPRRSNDSTFYMR